MAKNTQSGSFLAKHFPTLFKHFSENASQEDFNKAEQEAAVAFQQLQGNTTSTETKTTAETPTLDANLAALFPKAQSAISNLAAGDLSAFIADAQELQNRLNAQSSGNQAVSDDLKKAQADLTKAQTDLTAANAKITDLAPKAASWDAHKAALNGTIVTDDTTNAKNKTKADTGLSAKDQARVERLTSLKAKYPGLMADIDVDVDTEDDA